jgi:CSLREA domain-containing protein
MTSAKPIGSNSIKGRRTRQVSRRPTRRPAVEELESRLLLATFTVNSANDVDDGACSQQHCSLREAINAANVNPGKDVVAFGIPGDGIPTIHPRSELPVVTDRIVIDGTTQPAGRIEIDGSRTELAAGLSLQTGGSTVRGLVVNRFF